MKRMLAQIPSSNCLFLTTGMNSDRQLLNVESVSYFYGLSGVIAECSNHMVKEINETKSVELQARCSRLAVGKGVQGQIKTTASVETS
jgi:hypothetical protein